jgi:CxxC motif-containing protein (DUF1111 family)
VYQQQVTPALKAALGIDQEPIPPRATAQANRTTPDVLGFGLLDAVPDSTILSYADPDDQNKDGISGRPNRFFDPVPDPEIGAQDVALTNAFVRFLASPAPPKLDGESKRGAAVFAKIGCDECHVPKLKTGPSDVDALANREVQAYTDLLLHDMGPELADICLGLATPSEFRTEPLMGLRLSDSFLHDGRAKSIEEALRLHGGEATGARDRFLGLSAADRAALLAFLKRL